jgi:hypothetical protein
MSWLGRFDANLTPTSFAPPQDSPLPLIEVRLREPDYSRWRGTQSPVSRGSQHAEQECDAEGAEGGNALRPRAR